MSKSFEQLRQDLGEWTAPTAHTAHTTDRMSVRTDKSSTAKRPSVMQLQKKQFSRKERLKRGIHGFTLNDPTLV